MALRIVIDFDFTPPGRDEIHKIQNFGEALMYEFSKNPLATIDIREVDRATNRLCVYVKGRRYKTRAVRLIENVLARHFLTDIARISEDSTEASTA
jgi:hypothetical protein